MSYAGFLLSAFYVVHYDRFDVLHYSLFFFVFCLLVVLVRLSVLVQVIEWKDSSPKRLEIIIIIIGNV